VRKGAAEVRDVQNIADILVDPEGALERRTHWEKTSHALLVGVILHVLYAEERKTLTRVTEILAHPAQSFEKTLRRSRAGVAQQIRKRALRCAVDRRQLSWALP
jgi:type IV secretion system protein VirD4